MFQNQFILTTVDKMGVMEVSILKSLQYYRYWNDVSIAERAPLNDFNLIEQIKDYPN